MENDEKLEDTAPDAPAEQELDANEAEANEPVVETPAEPVAEPIAPMLDDDPVAPGAESEAVDAVMATETAADDDATPPIPEDIAAGEPEDPPVVGADDETEAETPEPVAQADGGEAQPEGEAQPGGGDGDAIPQADGAGTSVPETGDDADGRISDASASEAGFTPAERAGGLKDAEPGAPQLDDEELPILPPQEVRAIVEALIFTSPQPITPRELTQVLVGVSRDAWEAAITELKSEYTRDGRGLQLVEVAGGWQITTRPEYNDWLRELLDPRAPNKLSIQALETLAVIAYKQPVTMPEIIELRGVKSGGVIKTLLERRLIRITGRKEVVGRPMLYGTTKDFLLTFGLKSLAELPKIEEFADVLGEEVDVAGLKRAIETPAPVEIPLSEDEAAPPPEPPSAEPEKS